MRVLGMTKPVPLDELYTSVNILERIIARRRLTLEQLEDQFSSEDRLFKPTEETISGDELLNRFRKVVLLGKPGSGKTTFLKYAVLRAGAGKLSKNKVPIFIGLKRYSESGETLKDHIVAEFDVCDFPEADPYVERILRKGKALVLFDGLDEVGKADIARIARELTDFTDKYSTNQYIISCRIAAQEYIFEKFIDVELADFGDEQIIAFIKNWFAPDESKANICIDKMVSDISIMELGSVPLLLTLLCLVFEETMNFPKNKSELYKEALDILLKKWDAMRSIRRDEIYRNLSTRRKENLFSRLAAKTFEKEQHFFAQRMLEDEIRSFAKNLPGEDDETREPDSEAILKAIEAQHGIFVERAKSIYSFSHLSFHEYFTARDIVDHINKKSLEILVANHLFDVRWREVFVLIAGMLADADDFFSLMNEEIKEKVLLNMNAFKIMEDITYRSHSITGPISNIRQRILSLYHSLPFDQNIQTVDNIQYILHYVWELLDDLSPMPKNKSYHIRNTMGPELSADGVTYFSIYDTSGNLVERIPYAGGKSWYKIEFDEEALEVLKAYVYGNSVLLECLKEDCYISRELRQQLIDNFLLPPL